MSGPPITEFARSDSTLAAMAPCMDQSHGAAADAEWPDNIISGLAVAYESGVVARSGEIVRHAVDRDELALCRTLAHEAAAIMAGVEVGMGSESSAHFSEFCVAANVDALRPERIDESIVRRAFGGTIFPPATITVEPLKEAGIWWSEVVRDGEGQDDAYFAPWRALIAWFEGQQALVDAAFIRIGDADALSALRESEFPEGTEQPGCVLPRLPLGLTRAGSLVGLFGYAVQT